MDLWFGDSWVIGQELGLDISNIDKSVFPNVEPGDNPLHAFPTLISKHRKAEFINFAKSAASIEYALFQLVKFCTANHENLINSAGSHTAFLCLTAQIRGFGINYLTGKHLHYFNNYRKSKDDTEVYDSIMTVNSFYSICKLYNIDCVIIPVFCDFLIPEEFRHLTLFDSALLTDVSLVEETFGEKFIDIKIHETSMSENDFYLLLSSKDWISPNIMHPNIIGHRKLAYKLIELLENR